MSRVHLSKLDPLVKRYNSSREDFERSSSSYQEAEARSEFIDPFLEILGWDVSNATGLAYSAREVLREETQRDERNTGKKPDYTLRIKRQKKFFVEAKKPSVDILSSKTSIFQARSYGYTAGHPIVVLINFRNISIFDTTMRPNEDDPLDVSRIFTCSVDELISNIEILSTLIGREAVSSPDWYDNFDNFNPNEQTPVNKYLVERISNWKIQIASDVLSRNTVIDSASLEFVVQRLINRLLFVRMCEDRGIEGEKFLTNEVSADHFDILDLFRKLDEKYNSGLFSRTNVNVEPGILVTGQVVKSIVLQLYAPYSPFSFSVLGADLLGLVYEYALTEHLVIDRSLAPQSVRLVKKDEYSRRDVVTTPQQLVENTVAKGLSHLATHNPKVLDFAIGSGRFLIAAFNLYQSKLVEERIEDPNLGSLEKIGKDRWKIPYKEKYQMLLELFYGIDVDINAVEVSKFSLLVNLLEDETASTLPTGKKILPNLDSNIVHGNTLVPSLPGASRESLLRTVPFDISNSSMPSSFDFIIGNPPYMKTEEMKKLNFDEYNFLKSAYTFCHTQFDKYMPFIEFALHRLSDHGVASLIVPNKWMTNVSGEPVRKYLLDNNRILEIANFRDVRVFEDKDTYVCSLILGNNSANQITYSEPTSLSEYETNSAHFRALQPLDFSRFTADTWVLPANDREALILDRIASCSIRLGEVVTAKNGVQTSNNAVFILKASEILQVGQNEVEFVKGGKTYKIEKSILRRYLDDSRLVVSDKIVTPDSFIIYPYEPSSKASNTSGYSLVSLSNMKKSYPLAFKYLSDFSSQLQLRNLPNGNAQRPFYEFGRVQAIGTAPLCPKIFYTVNQKGDKYGLDELGVVYASGSTAGEVALYPNSSTYSLDFILGLLDQVPIEFFLRKSGSPFQGGYYSRGTSVIKEVPAPKLDILIQKDLDFHDDVSRLTRDIRVNVASLDSSPPAHLSTIKQTIAQLRRARTQLFLDWWGLTETDIDGLF